MVAQLTESSTADREMVIIRVLEAPRELVFAAFSDAEHLSNWWGPKGFTTTTHSMDFSEGGVWRYVMHGPDGRDYQNRIVYRRIVPGELIVCDHDAGDDEEVEPGCGRKYITFEPVEGDERRTKLTLKMVFPTAEERERLGREYGALQGAMDTLGRLAEHLGATPGMALALSDERSITLQRAFAAPAALVFDAWTKPEHVMRWFGCSHSKVASCTVDLRVGGEYRIEMPIDSGEVHTIVGTYRRIERPMLIEYTMAFGPDASEDDAAVVTVRFEEADGVTTLTQRVEYATTAARDATVARGFGRGSAESFEKLEALLGELVTEG